VYGGLGRVGLDHGSGIKDDGLGEYEEEELAPGFSTSALKFVKGIVKEEEEDEGEEFLLDGEDDEEVANELEKINDAINSQSEESKLADGEINFDKPFYKNIPSTDEEYQKILKDRFGHESFKEGLLEALKILLEKK
jgi:hypothetical protein